MSAARTIIMPPAQVSSFLKKDLETIIGSSGRPIILSFHLHPFGPHFDWPKEDLAAFWELIERYNVGGSVSRPHPRLSP